MIFPGATLGMIGGGQLGQMFTLAARRMGYQVLVLDPDPESPAAPFATEHLCASYQDPAALEQVARRCQAATVEFENVPASSLDYLAQFMPVRPSAAAVALAQDRITEKRFLAQYGFATAGFAVVQNVEDLPAALACTGTPALLKVSRFGYDGKGQARVENLAEAEQAFARMGAQACVLEEVVVLESEVSVLLARGADGATAVYPLAENRHQDGILEISLVPARIDPALATQAVEIAQSIARQLDYIGVLAVEFFIARDGRLLINELATRPHNSGHFTLDACVTSQFEQQLRALCGLPLGDTRLLTPAAMLNLLGDLWHERAPSLQTVLCQAGARLHLYGKRIPRPGRKMGHVTCLGKNVQEVLSLAKTIQDGLCAGAINNGESLGAIRR